MALDVSPFEDSAALLHFLPHQSWWRSKLLATSQLKVYTIPWVLWNDFSFHYFCCKRQLHLSQVKTENPAAQFFFIRFFIDDLIANIRLYAISWPKLNFGCYLTFEIIFRALKPDNSAFFMYIARFDRLSNPISWRFLLLFLLQMIKFLKCDWVFCTELKNLLYH